MEHCKQSFEPGGSFQIMLPYSHHVKSLFSQPAANSVVASAVTVDFIEPVVRVFLGITDMFWTTVPVAAIYEDHHILGWKVEIWLAQEFWLLCPSSDTRFN